jgi:glycosyltransferase involved in cell wall biosynthesis
MHVAHFIHRYPPALGGAESYVHRLTGFLQSHGHDVTVWTTTARHITDFRSPKKHTYDDPPHVRRFAPIGFPLRRYFLKALSFWPNKPWQLLTMPSSPTCPAMWRAVQSYDGPLDAVHAVAFPYGFLLACAWALAKRRKVPLLLTPFLHFGDMTDPHDRTRKQYTQPALRWMLNEADHVFVQTQAEWNLANQLGVSDNRLTLQGLGVDPAECTGGDRAKARAAWGVTDDTLVVGHLANLSLAKGSHDLALAAERTMNIHLVLAGPIMPNFKRACGMDIYNCETTFLGELIEQQKRDFFAGIDVFCLPSITDSYGLVLLEAWANSKPVVCYRAGGPGELVRDGVDGLLVPPSHIAQLADALQRTTPAMGEAGRLRVLSEHRWPDKLQKVLDVMLHPREAKSDGVSSGS